MNFCLHLCLGFQKRKEGTHSLFEIGTLKYYLPLNIGTNVFNVRAFQSAKGLPYFGGTAKVGYEISTGKRRPEVLS